MFAIELVTTENLIAELTRRIKAQGLWSGWMECVGDIEDALVELEAENGSDAGGT